jgi:hypothetical protein
MVENEREILDMPFTTAIFDLKKKKVRIISHILWIICI